MNDLTSPKYDQISKPGPQDYATHALSAATWKAYQNDLNHFLAWGGVIPASEGMVADYLTEQAPRFSTSTLKRRLVAISKAHRMASHTDPVRSQIVQLTMRGIRRVHGKPQSQVSPIMKDDLIVMLSHMPDNLKGCRDRALLLTGFCAALRRSELASIRCEDIEISNQGIVLTLPRSKTDQFSDGRKIGIPRGRGKICPVSSLEAWLEHSGLTTGPLFRAISKGMTLSFAQISDRAIANIVKDYALKAGLDPAKYSGHSLRSGLCSSAAQHGYSSWVIRKQSGHKTDAMLYRYIRIGDLFTDNAAALF